MAASAAMTIGYRAGAYVRRFKERVQGRRPWRESARGEEPFAITQRQLAHTCPGAAVGG